MSYMVINILYSDESRRKRVNQQKIKGNSVFIPRQRGDAAQDVFELSMLG